jgi:hypothetical protein
MTIASHRVPHKETHILPTGFVKEENAAMPTIHELPTVFILAGPLKGEATEPAHMHEWAGNCVGVVEEAHG